MFMECTKGLTECPYRYDYRGCIKNCPFPNEYEQIKPKTVENKINLNWKDYKRMNSGNCCSVGIISDQYAFENTYWNM